MVITKARLLKPRRTGDCMECNRTFHLKDMVVVKHRTIVYESGRKYIMTSIRQYHFECYCKVYEKLLEQGCEIEYVRAEN